VVAGCERSEEKAEMITAKLIEFYVPSRFRKKGKWIPAEQLGQSHRVCARDEEDGVTVCGRLPHSSRFS
jgi:hypothetical protein